jgi:UDP-2,3-diacylglucosamine pyrophosphatase LpxH
MAQIKYVVISDMHLGAENSLLTNLIPGGYQTDNTKPSPVLIKLVEGLRELISKNSPDHKPKLVLNGDLMEFALTSVNNASMAFQRFIELVMPEDESQCLFDSEIIFLAGNHDHNIWETSRYNYYVHLLKEAKPGEKINQLSHVTNLFEAPYIECHLLTALVQMYPHLKAKNVLINTAYPAFAVQHEQKDKCLIISHGHYIESMYSLMTVLDEMIFPDRVKPSLFQDLESENFAWIDFFWSTMGRSGLVGRDVQLLYDKMQDNSEVQRIISQIAKSLSMKQKNFVVRWIEFNLLKEVMKLTLGKQASKERNQGSILSGDALEGLKKLMEVYMLNQIKFELNKAVPSDMTFLFGHTHKPFGEYMDFLGYNGKVRVFNTGGWVVDTTEQMNYHGGTVLLVDDELDVVALKLYHEGNYQPSFMICDHDKKFHENNFYNCLVEDIRFDKEPWTSLAHTIEMEVNLRHQYLKEIIKSNSL